MGRKVLVAKSGRAACPNAAAGGGIAAKRAKDAKSFLTGLTGFTGLREASVKPDKTKPSGVEWIGDIPEGWEVRRLKYVASCNDDSLAEDTPSNFSFDYVDVGSVKYGLGIVQREPMVFADAPSRARRVVRKDDVIVSTVRTYLKSVAQIPSFNKPIIVSTGFAVLRAKNSDVIFLNYALQSQSFVDEVEARSTGISYPAINASDLVSIKILLPPLPEQRVITDYLDEKCGAIDAAVAEAKKGIEEYKAWKKSLIFEVVTGKRRVGFFNAESQSRRVAEKMKSSGIPWIGDVPEGWVVCKTLHSLCMPITDGPHTTPELFDDGIPFVSAEAVSCGNGSIDFNHARGFISEAFYNECCRKYIPQRDDIYMIKSGATTGRVAIVDTDRIFTIWSPLAVFRCNLKRAKPRYVFYYLQSSAYQGQVELAWSFGTQQNIGMRALEELKMVLPPLAEQRAIADYLDEKCSAIDAMVAEKEALIADLEAYKKSLIYEVVTGKREVASTIEMK